MYTIIQDTREQIPWSFTVAKTKVQKLDTGDYSIDGLEDILCIERKKSVAEFAHNIVDKRFDRELQRMAKLKYKFILLEFDYHDIDIYPEGSNIPQKLRSKIKITGSFIMSAICAIQMTYGIHVITCGNTTYAQYIAEKIMKRVAKEYGK